MSKNFSSLTKLFLALLVTASFSGCDLFKDWFSKDEPKKEETVETLALSREEKDDRPLVYLGDNKETVLTVGEFNKYLAQILKMYPQLNGAVNIDNLPAAFKKTFLNKIVDQKLIIREAKIKNYETDNSFQKSLVDATKLLKEHMLIQEFEKRLLGGVEVTDANVRGEYDKNLKSKYVKEQGGVLVAGVKFEKEDSASLFLERVKGKTSPEFSSLGAKESDGKFRNFGRVGKEHEAPQLSATLKKAILRENKFPTAISITDDKAHWVLHLSDKKSSEFYKFDEIKGQIEMLLRNQKSQQILAKEMTTLRKKYPISIEEELLTSYQPEAGSPSEEVAQNKSEAIAA
ncbi:hypothetical protein KAW80_03010 [Candidatus Babeliales bacterium]|nr:hypothetical protein [Candidatus Babeliales bacterium]